MVLRYPIIIINRDRSLLVKSDGDNMNDANAKAQYYNTMVY